MTSKMALRLQRSTSGTGASRGFTLIELLVSMTVLGILAAIAVPSFNEAFLSNRLASFSNSFIASAQLARSEAIKRNAVVKMCRSSNGTSCATTGGWQQGWIIFSDNGASGNADNGTVDSDETRISYQQALSTEYSFTGNNYSIAFQPSGLVASTVSLNLCRLAPSAGSQERTIGVGTTGRVSVSTTRTGICS
ncbi:GspH/FimT family pseudopilin [Polaromonas sp. P2-4]|nr:GspH/FimT family pseudopilin [Polaromonas sp. P2-4]